MAHVSVEQCLFVERTPESNVRFFFQLSEMTYEKLARAIRYYYHTGIMSSHPGRYTFRFGPKSGFGIDWNVGDFTQN